MDRLLKAYNSKRDKGNAENDGIGGIPGLGGSKRVPVLVSSICFKFQNSLFCS